MQKGFTLIELILVILIVGMIAALLVPALLGQKDLENARRASEQSSISNAKLLTTYGDWTVVKRYHRLGNDDVVKLTKEKQNLHVHVSRAAFDALAENELVASSTRLREQVEWEANMERKNAEARRLEAEKSQFEDVRPKTEPSNGIARLSRAQLYATSGRVVTRQHNIGTVKYLLVIEMTDGRHIPFEADEDAYFSVGVDTRLPLKK
jgi:prepilin-type N-terminal cleavage/methylation domain-containing protein